MDDAVFAERIFDLDDGALIVRFHVPVLAPGGEFQCRWSIGWPEGERCRYSCGIDGVQALMLAMRIVHTELTVSDAYRAGRLTYFGEADLDLPPGWDDEPLGLAPAPARR